MFSENEINAGVTKYIQDNDMRYINTNDLWGWYIAHKSEFEEMVWHSTNTDDLAWSILRRYSYHVKHQYIDDLRSHRYDSNNLFRILGQNIVDITYSGYVYFTREMAKTITYDYPYIKVDHMEAWIWSNPIYIARLANAGMHPKDITKELIREYLDYVQDRMNLARQFANNKTSLWKRIKRWLTKK